MATEDGKLVLKNELHKSRSPYVSLLARDRLRYQAALYQDVFLMLSGTRTYG